MHSFPSLFNFDRLGPRIPAIAISPWLAKGVDSNEYEHSSLPASITKLFNLTKFLNPRRKIKKNKFFKKHLK